MKPAEMWKEFCEKKGIDPETPYAVWNFCGGGPFADELAALLVRGIKFGTASAYDDYVIENELDEIPKIGDYSVLLANGEEAVCVIRDYDVSFQEFGKVSRFHGYSEGEEERTKEAWTRIHRQFFAPDLEAAGKPLSEKSLVVCEKLSVEYLPDTAELHRLMKIDSIKKYVSDGLVTAGELHQELYFVEPTLHFADEIEAYKKEILEAQSSFDGCLSLKRMPSAKEWVQACEEWEYSNGGTVLLCIRKSDQKLVGMIQIRHTLEEDMAQSTGHIGYTVRSCERGKGYAKWMLAHVKDFCQTLGIDEILICCLKENEASQRTILSNGGCYKDTIYLRDDQVYLDRYKIRI